MTCDVTSYCNAEGDWVWKPDLIVGEELYYGIEFDVWLTDENDVLDSVEWIIPAGLTNLSENIDPTTRIAAVKLLGVTAGTYVIRCTATSSEGANTQKPITDVSLTVVD